VKGGRVRNVDSKSQQDFITEARLQEFGKEMKSSICKKIDNLANLVKSQEKEKGKNHVQIRNILSALSVMN
jgi:hypothetical protein